MKPKTPPLVPYAQRLPWLLALTVSSAIAKETSRRLSRSEENIVLACVDFVILGVVLMLMC